MAAATTTITSSPLHDVRTPSYRLSHAPSSDDLPSLSELCKSRSVAKQTTSIVNVKDQSFPGFSSVRSLLHSGEFATNSELPPNARRFGLQDKYAHLSPSVSKTKALKDDGVKHARKEKDKAIGVRATDGAEQKHADFKGRSKEVEQSALKKKEGDAKIKEAHPTSETKQSKIPRTRITKPGSNKVGVKNGTRKKDQKALNVEPVLDERPEPGESLAATSVEAVPNIAVKRRLDWTPVKDTNKRSKHVSPKIDNEESDDLSVPIQPSFGQALGSFGFQQSPVCPEFPELANAEQISFVKGKQIDLVNDTKRPSHAPAKTKRTASPTKKATTITDKATAPYLVPLESCEPILDDKITRYLSGDPQVKLHSERRTLQKDRTKTKTSKTKKTKKMPGTILLSPTSAIKEAQDQELLFGTSSQLARDESPTVIAIKQSERVASGDVVRTVDVDESRIFSGLLAFAPSKKLWAAASRDFNESLLSSEPVVPPARYRNAQLSRDLPEPRKIVERQQKLQMGDFQDIDQLATHSERARNGAGKVQQSAYVADSECAGNSPTDTGVNELIMPNFETFSDASLKAQVAKYGFKAVKRRQDMIILIKQCWSEDMKRKHPAKTKILPADVLSEGDPNQSLKAKESPEKKKRKPAKKPPLETDANGLPIKKPRGRPKKKIDGEESSPKQATKKSMSVAPVDEISDAVAPNETAKRSRRPPPPKHLEHFHRDGSHETSTGRLKPCYIEGHSKHILSAISKAVTAQAPTNDIKHLSWHEKIVLYDPIIIEDFTDWLNSGVLKETSELGEPSPFLVKDWCEGKSVCCVWRETLRGKERARW